MSLGMAMGMIFRKAKSALVGIFLADSEDFVLQDSEDYYLEESD